MAQEFDKEKYVAVLGNMVDIFLERHGCFPLDNPKWKEVMGNAYTLVGQPDTDHRREIMKQFPSALWS